MWASRSSPPPATRPSPAIYRITAPTGEVYDVTAPEGATQDQAMAYAQAQRGAAPQPVNRPPMATFDISAARQAGYSDAQIADHLAQVSGFDAAGARKAGYSDADILGRLSAGRAAPQGNAMSGALATLYRSLPGASELGAFVDSRAKLGADLLAGKTKLDPKDPMGSLKAQEQRYWDASRAWQQGQVDGFAADHPVAAPLVTGTGYAAQAAAALASGGASEAPAAAAAAPAARSALARFAARTAAAAPKNATVGAAFAAANAAAQPGDLATRVENTSDAVIPGAVAGVAVPAGVDALSGVGRRVLAPAVDATAPIVRPLAARIQAAVDMTTGTTREAPRAGGPARVAGNLSNRLTAPEIRAAQAIKNAMDRDAAAGHVPDLSRPLRLGGGENVASLFDVVAQSPGPARQMMRTAASDARQQTSADIRSDLANSLGGRNDYFAHLDQQTTDRAAKAGGDLMEAFSTPIDPATFDAKIAPLLSRLPKGAMAAARDIARMEGRDPDELGLHLADTPTAGGVPDLPGQLTRQAAPTLETLHYLKKGIDQTLEPYRNPVTRALDLSGAPDAQAQATVRRDLGRAMRDVSEPYDRAMASWGEDSENINALKLGRNIFSPKFDMQSENLARLHADMSDEAKAQFQKGVGEAITAEVRKSGDIRAVRRLLGDNADEFRDRVALAFGSPEAFGQFLERMGGRAADAERDVRFFGGSPTYLRQAARADLEATGADPVDMAAEVLGGALHPPALAGRALKAAIKSLPRGTPQSAIVDARANAALGRAATDPDEVTRLLNLLQLSRRIAAAPQAQARLAAQVGNVVAMRAGAAQR